MTEVAVLPTSPTENQRTNAPAGPTGVQVEILPNYFAHRTTFHLTVAESTTGSLLIYNVSGQMVETIFQNRPLDAGQNVIRYEMRDLVPGMYYAVFKGKNEPAVAEKMVVHSGR